MWIVLLVLFSILVIVAYAAGVKREAAWGKPLLVIGVLLLVLVVLDRAVFHVVSGAGDGGARPAGGSAREAGQLIADVVRSRVGGDARVFAIARSGAQTAPQLMGGVRGLADGLGREAGEIEWSLLPPRGPGLAASIARQGSVDVVVLFGGLPFRDEQMVRDELIRVADTAEAPAVAVFLPSQSHTEAVRGWLREGLLSVAVIKTPDGLKVYRPDDLP
jgi:hypothetical protein